MNDFDLINDTGGMCVMCTILAIVGGVTAYIEEPQFHHGLMIGCGTTMNFVAMWRYDALSQKAKR